MPPTANDAAADALVARLKKSIATISKDDLGFPPAMAGADAGLVSAAGAGNPGGLQSLKDAHMMMGEAIAKLEAGGTPDDVAHMVEGAETAIEGFMLEVDADSANVAMAAKGMAAVMKIAKALYATKENVTAAPKAPQVATSERTLTLPNETGKSFKGTTPVINDQPTVPTEMPKPTDGGGGVYAGATPTLGGTSLNGQPIGKAADAPRFSTIAKAGDDDTEFKFPSDINGARRKRRMALQKRLKGATYGSPAYLAVRAEIEAEHEV